MPQEIEVWYILPSLRREFVRSLVEDHKQSQKQAAQLLGLTEAAVSQYRSQKRGKEISFNKHVLKEIREATTRIVNKQSHTIPEMVRISQLPDVKRLLCELHKKEFKGLNECSACFNEELLLPK